MSHLTVGRSLALFSAIALITAAPAARAQLSGLLGTYYTYDGGYLEDFTFSDPGYEYAFERIDSQIAFGWSQETYEENNANGWGFDWEPFGPGGGAFGVHWQGWLTIPEGEELYLGTETDDGSYLFVDGALAIDNGGQHYPMFAWSDSRYTAGRYRIDMYLFCNDLTPPYDKSGIDFWWSPKPEIVDESGWVPGDALDPVPEPGTLALMGLGLAGAAALRRKRRR